MLQLTGLAAVGVSGEGEEGAELLEGAENGRYKVVAKAEPYRNLPVSTVHMSNTINFATMISVFIFLLHKNSEYEEQMSLKN